MSRALAIGLGAATAIVLYLLAVWIWPWRSCSWCQGVGECRWCDHGRKYRPGAKTIGRLTRSTRL